MSSSEWKCQEHRIDSDGYTCLPDGSWECPKPVKHEDGFSCNGVRYYNTEYDKHAYDYLFEGNKSTAKIPVSGTSWACPEKELIKRQDGSIGCPEKYIKW